ncbi:uncharacterized protein LOC119113007 isoform X1 [Pollicipes pollicipes]|uniref:uncharacterized protein LOC119113007 isoform X1 n=1 Tax=Pollicipes pollicipes TaxID=41117 RepID=UPI001884B3A3|nr:uncharacterized protein LOC119113007 isoform X1 [Pollicipes pollicipes]
MPDYKYNVLGVVVEIFPLKKAVISFQEDGREQRALLWGERLVCEDGRLLPERRPIDTVLAVGDSVLMDCHIYDNKNSQDRCDWYVARAQLASSPQPSDVVSNVSGKVDELTRTRGFVVFRQPGRSEEQRAVFVVARYFARGQRLPAGSSLFDHLEEDQVVNMDAVHGAGRLEAAGWYAPLVWRGQKPDVRLDPQPPPEVLAEEDGGALATTTLASSLLPALSSADARRRSAPGTSQDKWGYVASLLSAEYGLLMCQVAPRRYESVLFHNSVAHLSNLNLKNYDLRAIFKKGDHLRFEAEPSDNPGVYRWRASSVWVDMSQANGSDAIWSDPGGSVGN